MTPTTGRAVSPRKSPSTRPVDPLCRDCDVVRQIRGRDRIASGNSPNRQPVEAGSLDAFPNVFASHAPGYMLRLK